MCKCNKGFKNTSCDFSAYMLRWVCSVTANSVPPCFSLSLHEQNPNSNHKHAH